MSLNVTRGGVTEIILSPLDTSRKRPMHAITVHYWNRVCRGNIIIVITDLSRLTGIISMDGIVTVDTGYKNILYETAIYAHIFF